MISESTMQYTMQDTTQDNMKKDVYDLIYGDRKDDINHIDSLIAKYGVVAVKDMLKWIRRDVLQQDK